MPFQIDYIPIEFLRDYEPIRNLLWKRGLLDFENFWRSMLPHDFHNVLRCDCSGFGNRSRSVPIPNQWSP
jgi:hypothetical protein